MTQLRVTQKFILPASLRWGGFYERLIRVVKNSLKKNFGHSFLTYEEMSTILCDIKSVISCRPLTYLNEDDLDVSLTPNHIIYGTNIHSIEGASTLDLKYEDFSKTVKHACLLLEHFGKRFDSTYVQELIQRDIYRRNKISCDERLIIGDVVCIKDDKPLPRSQ